MARRSRLRWYANAAKVYRKKVLDTVTVVWQFIVILGTESGADGKGNGRQNQAALPPYSASGWLAGAVFANAGSAMQASWMRLMVE
jgi:hypothetical protein